MKDDKTLAALVLCPLCGADKGYKLDEGSTYRWWSVVCAECGQEVSEARATYPAETTPRTRGADFAWNEAGKHAQSLRDRLAVLAASPPVQQEPRQPPELTHAMFLAAEKAGVSFGTQQRCWNAWFGSQPQEVALKPLTEEHVTSIIHTRHFAKSYPLKESDKVCLAWFRLGVRDGEIAHGIYPVDAKKEAASDWTLQTR